MDALCAYMSESEKQWAIIESVIDNRLLRVNYEFDKLMMEHTENLISIENKVMMESGTSDDLEALYLAEAEEIKKEGQGILSKIISAVKAFFKKIRDVLFGKKPDEKSLPEQVEVPEDPEALKNQGNKLINGIKSFFSGKKGALRAVGITAAAAGTVVITKKKIIPAIKSLDEFVSQTEQTLGEAESKVDGTDMTPEEQGMVKKAVNDLKALGSRASKCVKAMGTQEYKDFKNNKIIQSAQATRQKAEDLIKSKKEENDKIDEYIKKLESRMAMIKKKTGNKDSMISRITSKDARDAHAIDLLEKKHKEGKWTDEDREKYNALKAKVAGTASSSFSEIKRIMDTIASLTKDRAKNVELIKQAGDKSYKATNAEAKATASLSGSSGSGPSSALSAAEKILGESVIFEQSVEELITTSNAEIDYFVNSLL